jgi:exosortase A-associated hydrolase 2
MAVPLGATVEPFFLDSPDGPLFAILHRPPAGQHWVGSVLCCMPFNEEMNRCRSMVTLLARTLSEQGLGLLLVDLLGTGDSAGDYSDARWETWIANLDCARQWLGRHPGGCRAVLGIRLGALLAASVHARCADASIDLVLWQPVLDGKTHLTQFMRVRIAANMDRSDLPKETTASMRQRWQAGEVVEVAGYALHPALAQAIDQATLAAQHLPAGTRLLWLEQVADAGAPPGPASQRLLERWPGTTVTATVRTFTGPAFWQLSERVLAPEVIAATADWLVSGRGAS